MIGIMKPAYTKHTDHDLLKEEHWLNYCASCKSIGNEYGQIYRAGLNYDLALLGQLAPEYAFPAADAKTLSDCCIGFQHRRVPNPARVLSSLQILRKGEWLRQKGHVPCRGRRLNNS